MTSPNPLTRCFSVVTAFLSRAGYLLRGFGSGAFCVGVAQWQSSGFQSRVSGVRFLPPSPDFPEQVSA